VAKVGKSPRGRYKIPAVLAPAGRVCFCLNLPDNPEHFATFWGHLDLLGKGYTWGEPKTADSDVVAAYWAQINRDNRDCFEEVLGMANRGCGCGDAATYRYNQQGIQEVSNDGGATWSEAGSDPRVSGTIIPPPLWLVLGGDNRCNGAISATEGMRFVTDLVVSDETANTITLLIDLIIAALVAFIPGLGAIAAAIIAAVAYVVLTVGRAAIETAMTSGVYDTLKCIFFCHINQDATFDESGWQAVKADIADQLTDIAEVWCWHIVNIAGPVGLSNMARTLHFPQGNCDECSCESCDVYSVWQYNYQTGQWFHPEVEDETHVILTSMSAGAREVITVAFGSPYPDGGCCNIVAWEQISGNQIFIVDQVDCADQQTSGALPPSGCWKQITIYSQLEPEPPQVWRMTLGAECP